MTAELLATMPTQVDAIRNEREARVMDIVKSPGYLALLEREAALRERMKKRDDEYEQLKAELAQCRLTMRKMITW